MELIDFLKENKFAGCEKIYIHPHIPAKKLSNALVAYNVPIDPKEVAILIDDTVFGSGKDGVLICKNRLIIREAFSDARIYEYNSIKSINCESRRIYIDKLEAHKLTVPGKNELAIFFKIMNQWMSNREPMTQGIEQHRTKIPQEIIHHGIGKYLFEISQNIASDKIHAHPNIPAKKLQSAIGAYGNDLAPDDVIILIDDTTFGSAKDGVLITEKSIHIKIFTEAPRTYEWAAIESISTEKRTIYINGLASGTFLQIHEREIGFLFKSINAHLNQDKSSDDHPLTQKDQAPNKAPEHELSFDLDAVLPPTTQRKTTTPQESSEPPTQEHINSIDQNEASTIATIVEAEIHMNHPSENEAKESIAHLPMTAKESKAKDKLLAYIATAVEQNKSKIIPLIKEKTGEASIAALRDDANVEKLAVFLYAFLPSIIRLALKEQTFVQFMLDNRDKILLELLTTSNFPASQNSTQQRPDIEPKPQEPGKKLSAFAANIDSIKTTIKKPPSLYLKLLNEYQESVEELNQRLAETGRLTRHSQDTHQHIQNYHLTKFSTEILRISIKSLENISSNLSVSSRTEALFLTLDPAILIMLSYATASMSFLLYTEGGFDSEQVNELLAPVLEMLVIPYAQQSLETPTHKTLKNITNPYETLLASEILKEYKSMSTLFSKNISRQDSRSLTTNFNQALFKFSREAFDSPDERVAFFHKLDTDEARQIISDELESLYAELESTLVNHLEGRSDL
jgi:hypothetical protein